MNLLIVRKKRIVTRRSALDGAGNVTNLLVACTNGVATRRRLVRVQMTSGGSRFG